MQASNTFPVPEPVPKPFQPFHCTNLFFPCFPSVSCRVCWFHHVDNKYYYRGPHAKHPGAPHNDLHSLADM